MKVCMITDTHFGAKNDAPEFVSHQIEFYTNVFFPHLVKHNIHTILHLGDIFDRRKYTNHHTLQQFREFFFDMLIEFDIKMYIIIGNHDTYFKSTNDVNAPSLFLGEYSDHVILVEEPTVIKIDDIEIAMMPWINAQNYQESLDFMDTHRDTADVLCGHFEIRGFEMHRGGGINTSGLKAEIFKGFPHVYSGHFHEPSKDGSIMYLGAPYEYTWADHDCQRGFYELCTKSGEVADYIVNPLKMHHRIMYDEFFDAPTYDASQLTGKIVRLIVAEKLDNKEFEDFVERVEHAAPFNFEVVDNSSYHIAGEDVDEEALKNEDTLGIVESYVEQSEVAVDKERLNKMFKSLYIEALSEE